MGNPSKVIAIILGLLLLVGGVGAGVVLVNQQQLFRQKAAENLSEGAHCSSKGVSLGTCSAGLTCSTYINNSSCISSPDTVKCFVSSSTDLSGCTNVGYCQSDAQNQGYCVKSNVSQKTATACPSEYSDKGCSPVNNNKRVCSSMGGEFSVIIEIDDTSCVVSSTSSGGGGQSSGAGTICSNGCCTVNTTDHPNFHIKECTCKSNTGACNEICNNNAGTNVCISTPSCGSIQIDITDNNGNEVSIPGQTQILMHAAQSCTSSSNSGTPCSCYCAGTGPGEQCSQQNGVQTSLCNNCGFSSCSPGLNACYIASSGGGGGGGGAPLPTPISLKACGQACTSDSQCFPTGANGGTERCISGICQNTACVGKTIPGRNCDCSNLNACGNPCSASLGLCQSGSICRYIVGSVCTVATATNHTTYCVPSTLPTAWNTKSCVTRDQGNSYVLNSSGANPTVAEIQTACAPATPTPTPGAVPACTSIKAFDTNWNQLSLQDLTSLKAGSIVRFTVAGSAASGNFDKARFTINSVLGTEVTGLRPGTQEFYDEYTIPVGTTSFTISAQIHHQQTNTWN